MSDSISILPDQGRVRTFACPACGQTIALGCDRCRFCSVAIDPAAAEAAAALMDRVNLACSEAANIRFLFSSEPSEYLVVTERTSGADLYLFPFQVLRWWIRFGSLRVNDQDLISARRHMTRYACYVGLVIGIALVSAALGIKQWF